MSKTPVETYKPSPGKLRTSQLITTFGPGALMQTEYDSVLIMGTNFWWHKNKFTVKSHIHLQKIFILYSHIMQHEARLKYKKYIL